MGGKHLSTLYFDFILNKINKDLFDYLLRIDKTFHFSIIRFKVPTIRSDEERIKAFMI